MKSHWHLFKKIPQHKYAINAAMLGDFSTLAWSNLGLWINTTSYPQACQNLARHLAESVDLTAQDKLIDLGCGQGASLRLWQDHFHVQYIEAVELQSSCVEHIQKQQLLALKQIHQCSFLVLQPQQFKHRFDVALCIDALYHHALPDFLNSIQALLVNNGRIGFHYLMLNDAWKAAPTWQKIQYRYLLKCADVQLEHLSDRHTLTNLITQAGFHRVQIETLTQPVFAGFADYAQQHLTPENLQGIHGFKIRMTAQLCQKLSQDGLIDYVQVTAQL